MLTTDDAVEQLFLFEDNDTRARPVSAAQLADLGQLAPDWIASLIGRDLERREDLTHHEAWLVLCWLEVERWHIGAIRAGRGHHSRSRLLLEVLA